MQITKAIILIGGYGTRLRPLTLTTPKPLINFVHKPILFHQIDSLYKSGIRTIILAMNYMTDTIQKIIEEYTFPLEIQIIYSIEQNKLGTAGPIAHAIKYLNDEPFFVINGDIICDYPFIEMINYHITNNNFATILVTKVDNPNNFGVLKIENNFIKQFVEKPKEFIGDIINAGIYLFDNKILEMLECREMSLEHEIFPILASKLQLKIFQLIGFWKDVGNPCDYLIAQKLFLNFKKINNSIKSSFSENVEIIDSVIEENVVLGNNIYICNSTIMKNSVIGDGVVIVNSIVAKKCYINNWVRIEDSVIGDGVCVSKCLSIRKSKVLHFLNVNLNLENEIVL